jgi:hypothetical protein
MKKQPFYKRPALVLALAIATTGVAQAEWLKSYDSGSLDVGYSIRSAQGGIYQNTVGNEKSKFSSLALLNDQGVPLWRRKLYTGGIDTLAVVELPSGQLFVGGFTRSTTTAPTKAVWGKFNVNRATGSMTRLFSKTYNGAVKFFRVFPDASLQNIFGMGEIQNSNTSTDLLISQINLNNGTPLWTRVLNSGPFDSASAIFPIAGNRYVLTGQTSTQSDSSDQKILIGLLNSTGQPIAGTFKKYGASGAANSGSLQPISGGNYLLVGTSNVMSTSPFGLPLSKSTTFVIKLNSSFNIVWKKTFQATKDASISALSAIENSNGSLLINARFTPAFTLTDPFASSKQHPVTLRLSATGGLLGSKRYEFGDIDSGLFIAAPGGYLFQGTTMNLNQVSAVGGNSVYGKYDASLQPAWNRTLPQAGLIGAGITPFNNGYLLSGMINFLQNQNTDLLLGQLNDTGDVPGCAEIEPIAPTIVNAGISSANLSWTPAATTVQSVATPLLVQNLPINNQATALPTVSTLCN